MCRGGTTAENYCPTRPSGREAARLVFVVASYRGSRRNAKGRRNTDPHLPFRRTARWIHQRVAMAIREQTIGRGESETKETSCEEDIDDQFIFRRSLARTNETC